MVPSQTICARCGADALALSPFDYTPLCGSCYQREAAGPLEVILVENDDAHALMLSRHFAEAGYRLRRCANAGAALAAMRERRPDVIVSALELGDLDGAQLLARVAIEQPSVRRILYSSVPLETPLLDDAGTLLVRDGSPHALLAALAA